MKFSLDKYCSYEYYLSHKFMWGYEGVEKYWQEQAEKSDSPCHYNNKWQDKYAFEVRTGAFKKSDFKGFKKIVDIGCGVGDYTLAITRFIDPDAKIYGFDFPFNIEIAKQKHSNEKGVEFFEGPVPSRAVEEGLKNADAAVMTTVYVHLPQDSREALLKYFQKMKKGAKIFLLEYFPEKVPEFQKGLGYKEVETPKQTIEMFSRHNLKLQEVRHVNFIDSFLFHHLGVSSFSYFLTKVGEWFIRLSGYKKSKYKLLIFQNL